MAALATAFNQFGCRVSCTRLDRKFSRDVRLHGVWLLCCRYRPDFLPQFQRVCVTDALPDDVWRRISDAAVGRDHSRKLCRPARTPPGSDSHAGAHGGGDAVGGLYSRLCQDRDCRAALGPGRTPGARFFSRSGSWRGLGVSCRNRDAGPQRLLYELAIHQPADGGDLCRSAGPDGCAAVGMARAAADRMRADSVPVLGARFAPGDASVPGEKAPSFGARNLDNHDRSCAVGRSRDDAVGSDHREFLHDHGLYAYFRQQRFASCQPAESTGDLVCRRIELHPGAGDGSAVG